MVLGSPICLEERLQMELDGLGSDEEYRRAETVQLGKRTKPLRDTMTRLPMPGQSEDEEAYCTTWHSWTALLHRAGLRHIGS